MGQGRGVFVCNAPPAASARRVWREYVLPGRPPPPDMFASWAEYHALLRHTLEVSRGRHLGVRSLRQVAESLLLCVLFCSGHSGEAMQGWRHMGVDGSQPGACACPSPLVQLARAAPLVLAVAEPHHPPCGDSRFFLE